MLQIPAFTLQYRTLLSVYPRMEGIALAQANDIIVRRVKMGDTIRSMRERLLRFIRGRVRDRDEAEDLVQDVFFQLAASENVAAPIEDMTAWLFTVARNRVTDWYRKKREVSMPVVASDEESDETLTLADLLFDPEDSPENAYWRSLVWEELGVALRELPEPQRQVFVWHEFEGKSFKDIAALTGEPISTLISRKRYAVLALRERLQDLYDELDSR